MGALDELKKPARDWKVTSYGDVAALVGVGGKLTHLKFYSPSLNKSMHTVLIDFGLGAEISIDFSFLGKLNNFLTTCNKTKESVTAEYKNLLCMRTFSRYDISGAQAVGVEASVTSICGIKCSAVSAYKNGLLLFDIPAEVSGTFGIGGGAAFTAGFFFAFGKEVSDAYAIDPSWKRDNRKSASEMFPRQPL